jgi:hypothetical protein
MTWLEALDPVRRLKRGALDEIIGVGPIPRPFRQPPGRPALERLEMPCEQPFDGLLVPRRARSISVRIAAAPR